MSTSDYILIFTWIFGGLMVLVTSLFAYGVYQMQSKVNDIADQLKEINATLGGIEKDLRGELSALDRRVGQITTAMRALHPDSKLLDGQ